MLRNTNKSPYVKEYTYLQSDESQANGQRVIGGRKPDPRDHGFSYMDSDKTSPMQQSGQGESATSPSRPQQATGLAFTYKLDSSPAMPIGGIRTPSNTGQRSSAAITPLSSSPKKGSTYGSTIKPKEFYTTSPKSVTYPVKSSPALVTLEERSTPKARTPSAMSGAGSTGDYSQHIGGRGSRLSKDSKLEHSSSESISSGSSLDEYEKENVGSIKPSSLKTVTSVGVSSGFTSKPATSTRPYTSSNLSKPAQSSLITPAFGKSPSLSSSTAPATKSPPPPVLPKPTSLFDQPSSAGALKSSSSFQQNQRSTMYGKDGYGQPTITHASRKLMVTNADGSTIETEEILEPETMTSHSTTTKTKPVVVGVVPSNYSRSDSV